MCHSTNYCPPPLSRSGAIVRNKYVSTSELNQLIQRLRRDRALYIYLFRALINEGERSEKNMSRFKVLGKDILSKHNEVQTII